MAEQLTDKELRKELTALGDVSVGPITDTTRPLYVRKLKTLRENKKATASTSRRRFASKKLLGFSSDESGDDAPAPPAGGGGESVEQGSTRRRAKATSAAAKTTTAANRRIPGRPRTKPESQSERIPRERPSPALPLSRRSLRSTSRTVITSPELRRESPPKIAPASDFGPLHSTAIDAGISTSVTRHSINNETFEFSDSDNMEILDLDSDEDDIDVGKVGSDTNNSSTHMVTTGINTSSWLDNTFGSFANSFTSNKSSRSVTGTTVYNRFTPQTSSPLIQNLRPVSPCDRQPRRGVSYEPSSANAKAKPSKPVQMASESKQSFSLHISTFLLILAVFFFILLTFAYLNVTSSSATDVVSGKQLICSKSDHSGKVDSDCSQAEAPLVLVKSIINMLAIRAGNYDCGAEVYGRNMSLLEVEEELRKMHGPNMLGNLEKAIELIQMNAQWRIRLLNATGHTSEKSENTVVAMESEQSNMSLLCRLRRSARFVGYIVVVAVIAALFVTVVIAALRYKWRERERRAQEVYKIVEQIIEILQRHCEDNEGKDGMKPYLAIPHVRDMLIAPADRAQKQALWDKAVKFLSANESRIRVETQKIHGEEFAVWRWLQPVPNGSRVWQGQAFGEYRDTSLNAPPCSSTPCLKIRNMFDPDIEYGDDWHIYVQDAILEKCSTNHSILHIAVDRNSKEGCVYVKFATPESAGRAFKALHGWWFDGNLVTVKYLRLERYHERFPDSIGITAYMQPSNSQKKSLSVPFYRSVLETS